jgi:hypothetical protein
MSTIIGRLTSLLLLFSPAYWLPLEWNLAYTQHALAVYNVFILDP